MIRRIVSLALLFVCLAPGQLQEERMTLLTDTDYSGFPYLEPDHRYHYGDDAQQFAELYLPDSPAPHPVILFVHGGCYYEMYDLKPTSSIARTLADEGFAVWNIEYRRAGNGGDFPNMFLDVGAAADHLRQIAAEHDLELSSVITVGHSAGGHLALWLAGRARLAKTSVLYSAAPLDIAGLVGLAPLPDIAYALEQGMCGPALPLVMGSDGKGANDTLLDVSPRELVPLGISQILIVGSEDAQIVPNVQRYVEVAQTAGDDIELITLDGAGHFEIVAVGTTEWDTVLAAIHRIHASIAKALP